MNNPIRILLVDDHALFRESLVRLLESESDCKVVGHCATIAQARQILSRTPVDVILLDYDLGEELGTDLLDGLRIRESSLRILMVTAGMRDSATLNALNTGVAGVIFKTQWPRPADRCLLGEWRTRNVAGRWNAAFFDRGLKRKKGLGVDSSVFERATATGSPQHP